MKALVAGLVVLAVVAGAGSAWAAAPKQPRKEFITFDKVVLEGSTVGPAGALVVGKPAAKFTNLIKTRADFSPELARSVDNL